MKNYTRTLIRDIKAAARIGHIESLWAAIDHLAQTPEVKGNHPLNDAFINQVIVPVAQALSGPRVSKTALQPLLTHPKTAIRAVAFSALALRYLHNTNGTILNDLTVLAKEPRQEVRAAVVTACQLSGTETQENLNDLITHWLNESSPRLQGVAVRLLPELPAGMAIQKLEQLTETELPTDPEIRSALVTTINQIGKSGSGSQAIALLKQWADRPETFYWVISRCLANSWAAEHPDEALQILTRLAKETGPKKKTRNALQTLAHNGGTQLVRQTIQSWMDSDHPNLKAAGEDAYLKLIKPNE